MSADAKKVQWEQTRKKAWSGFTGLTNRMVDSPAYQTIRSAHAVKVLTYFWQMAEYPKQRRRPGQESPIGNLKKVLNNGRISFTYQVARYRGMRADQFSHALRELFRYGFIDIASHGQGVKGDYTKFSLSDRWKDYDTPQWEEIPFPRSYRAGYASAEYQQRRRRERDAKKNSYGKAELQTPRRRSYEVTKTANDSGIAELKTDISTDLIATESRSLSRSTKGYSTSGCNKNGVDPQEVGKDRARRDDAKSSIPHSTGKPWRPPKAEIQENVVEILRQRPDPRADDRRFVSFLTDQLQGVQRGRFDAERVHRDLRDRHDLDVWTAALLFAVSTIEFPTSREAVH